MEEQFWDLREALRRENTLVRDEWHTNFFSWRHNARKRCATRSTMAKGSRGVSLLCRASPSLAKSRKALARIATMPQ